MGDIWGKRCNEEILSKSKLTFAGLVDSIKAVDTQLAQQASKAINISLTLRNWLIGMYIAEYEQNGKDRASYGDKLLENLSSTLFNYGLSRVEERELRRYRQFYQTYPQIRESLTPELRQKLASPFGIATREKRESATPETAISGKELINRLTFTHIAELLKCDDPLKRVFYEVECIRGNWSVRELKRQIATLYYERSGLSTNKKKLAELVQSNVESAEPKLTIRDPYIFEFLGLKAKEVMGESHLEDALLDKLQDFLLELGHGFCFEARQKRILIGSKNCFVDLVFYHRILKCHVLIELKIDEFNHEHIGQLNTYVSWFKENMMAKGDNPPVGILLCTAKDHTFVEYALAGMTNKLFVSKYQLELPKKEEMELFIAEQMKEVQG
ncbi:MAG: cytoplasmic protein [Syntrophus sp. (in: bacteria)]|nr:cytoplasmic protein [Syntrophus sp. (in: bacteria)]